MSEEIEYAQFHHFMLMVSNAIDDWTEHRRENQIGISEALDDPYEPEKYLERIQDTLNALKVNPDYPRYPDPSRTTNDKS